MQSGYFPNHNFADPASYGLSMGRITFAADAEIGPGDEAEVEINFPFRPGPDAAIYVGRDWLVQEGFKVVGEARVLEVLEATPQTW